MHSRSHFKAITMASSSVSQEQVCSGRTQKHSLVCILICAEGCKQSSRVTVWHQQLESMDPDCHVSTGHAECSSIRIHGFFPVALQGLDGCSLPSFNDYFQIDNVCLVLSNWFQEHYNECSGLQWLPHYIKESSKIPFHIDVLMCSKKSSSTRMSAWIIISKECFYHPVESTPKKTSGCLTTNRGPEQH